MYMIVSGNGLLEDASHLQNMKINFVKVQVDQMKNVHAKVLPLFSLEWNAGTGLLVVFAKAFFPQKLHHAPVPSYRKTLFKYPTRHVIYNLQQGSQASSLRAAPSTSPTGHGHISQIVSIPHVPLSS
jgi:hypothetical protein